MTQRSKIINTLPLHLSLSLMNWLICSGAWRQQSGASSSLKPPLNGSKMLHRNKSRNPQHHPDPLSEMLQQLQSQLQSLNLHPKKPQQKHPKNALSNDPISALLAAPQFAAALQRESQQRVQQMLQGVQAYQRMSVMRHETPHRILWRKANASLRDYGAGAADAPAVLCIPSLINRADILDLSPTRSMVKHLRDAGMRPLVLDWDTPSLREKGYQLGDYVHLLLLDAIDALRRQHRGPIMLLGYCMGGLLAMAAAQLRTYQISGLALLATPWKQQQSLQLSAQQWAQCEQLLLQQEVVQPLVTQTLFHLLDPWLFQEKFRRFCTLDADAQQHFAQIESWVNDGVPLARGVAQECFIHWSRDDYFASGKWQVAGQVIAPEYIPCPVFIVTPQKDRIVTPQSSEPLAKAFGKHGTWLRLDGGHISMVAGSRAESELYEPLTAWVKKHAAKTHKN
jgi:polyhydroxyalkanoate synthase subunit PhaC